MVKLRSIRECLAEAEKRLARCMELYHESARKNGELNKQTVFYANLCNNAAKRVTKWRQHPPVTR